MANSIKHIILDQLRGAPLSGDDRKIFEAWLAGSEDNRTLFDAMNDPALVAAALAKIDRLHEPEMWARVNAHSAAKRVPFLRRTTWWAAAVLLILLGTGGYFLFVHKTPPAIAATQPQQQRFKNDVPPPAGSQTVLTLAGGQQIILDSAASGALAEQGNARVLKLPSGALAYNPVNEKPTAVVYNTLSTKKGGQTSVLLPDGTKVWLNALSSLRFPTAFVGAERRVEITGEAYFEVAKNAAMPFKVACNNGVEVNVFGTHFNVNAYDDEAMSAITLLEGSVRVTRGSATASLTPGQQAQVDRQGSIKRVDHADTEQAVAWKNGVFLFHSVDIATLLRQVARWYDVEIVYEQQITTRFNGEVSRNTPVSDLLKAMELSGEVKFGIEGKKIIVLQ